MPFNFPCPKCGRVILNVPESYAGQRGRCLNCKDLVNIPTLVVNEIQEAGPVQSVSIQTASTGRDGIREAISVVASPQPPVATNGKHQEDFPLLPDIPRRASRRGSFGKGMNRSGASRRYPELRRYCGMLTVLSLVVGGGTILTGICIAVSPFLSGTPAGQTPASSTAGLLVFLWGLALSTLGYAGIVAGMAVVEFFRVAMDIEENSRRLLESSTESEISVNK